MKNNNLKDTTMTGSGMTGIGRSMRRVEDNAQLLGVANFIDDINLPGQSYVSFVRSPHANARVIDIHRESVREIAGVEAIFTAADLDADGVGRMDSSSSLRNSDNTPIRIPQQTALTHHARFVGDSVAMIIARTQTDADEAASALDVRYESFESVVDLQTAVHESSPLVWPKFGSNIALDWQSDAGDTIDRIFADAHHISRCTVRNNRIMLAALEPRGAVASFDKSSQRLTIWTPTQGGTQIQNGLVNAGIADSPSQIRVITPDVGGGFGLKNGIYPEQVLVAWAARKLATPLKWYATRSDAFQCDYHARDHIMSAELALDANGRFLAIRSDVVSNMGAYLTDAAPIIPTVGGTRMLANVYRIPVVHARTKCMLTHTTPISAFRGAGKPEYAHLVESVVDQAASDLHLDPIELRRTNLITEDEMPWQTPTGLVYDSGNFEAQLDDAVARTQGIDKMQRTRHALDRGRLYGYGLSVYTEPDGFKDNRVDMSIDPRGHLTVITSAQTNGQGHFTTYTQIAESLFGITADAITVIEGDTDRTGFASGSGGSRSATVTGAAMHYAAMEIIDKGTQIAAHLLETNRDDIEFHDGEFKVAGTDRSVGWVGVANLAHSLSNLPPGVPPGLEANHHYDASTYCFPSGCHICEVEIDLETGVVEPTRYLSVSDFGTVINPMLVEGQLHGGIAQGLSQVLYEHTTYDNDSGQLLSGSFMDYRIAKAVDLPMFEFHTINTRCSTNPLGTKGCGESGPTAALPAVSSAVLDALKDYDTSDLQMPFTPDRVWRVLNAGKVPR